MTLAGAAQVIRRTSGGGHPPLKLTRPRSCVGRVPEDGRRLGVTQEPRRVNMRSIVIAAAMALGLGLAGIQTSSAAPVNGTAIHDAAQLGKTRDVVHWRWRHHHWWWW